MSKKDIIEVENKYLPRYQKLIKEKKDINIPLVIAENIPKKMFNLCIMQKWWKW